VSEITNDLATDVFDREQIDLLLSLDDGAGAVLTEIVGEFFATSDQLRTQLERAVGEADLEATQRVAHTLKGASANVGATGLSGICGLLEVLAQDQSLEELMRQTTQFEVEYERACDALRVLTGGI
jgi:hypothetical protein